MADLEHGRFPVYRNAGNCDHLEPPEPAGNGDAEDAGWLAREEWEDGHPSSRSEDGGEPICLSSQIGWFCPACTEVAQAERDLPVGEHAECTLPASVREALRG